MPTFKSRSMVSEAEPDNSTIAELFARDPQGLTRENIGTIVAKFRAMRVRYVSAGQEGSAGKPPTRLTKKEKAAGDLLSKTSELDDLLDL